MIRTYKPLLIARSRPTGLGAALVCKHAARLTCHRPKGTLVALARVITEYQVRYTPSARHLGGPQTTTASACTDYVWYEASDDR